MAIPTRRIFLIFHGRFPGEKAAAVFTAKNAEAFADAGFSVTVLAPRRLERIRELPSQYFGVKNNFRTVYLPIIDLYATPFLKQFAFLKSYATFSSSVFFYLLFAGKRTDIIYSNEALPLLLASCIFPNTFYEVHDFPRRSFINRLLLSRVKGIISTNRWKRDELVRLYHLKQQNILYEPNAVDTLRFIKAAGHALRERLPLPLGTVLIGYAGTLKTMEMEKGIKTLLEAIALLPPRFRCVIIGGLTHDIAVYREMAKKLGVSERVVFVGWMHYDSVPEYLSACDVLVAPFPKTTHYDLYMSPMKVFEYMAAGKPIVASRLHAIEEIIDDASAFLVTPGDAKALADGISMAATDASASARALRARELSEGHTWAKRASRIIEFCDKKVAHV